MLKKFEDIPLGSFRTSLKKTYTHKLISPTPQQKTKSALLMCFFVLGLQCRFHRFVLLFSGFCWCVLCFYFLRNPGNNLGAIIIIVCPERILNNLDKTKVVFSNSCSLDTRIRRQRLCMLTAGNV